MIVIDALEASNWDRELLEELRAGGVTAVHITLVFWEDARATLDNIGHWHRLFENHGDIIMPVRSAADIEEAKRVGKTGIIFGFQNCSPIEDDLALVQVFHELGVRIMQLTYNNQSLIGAGCYEKVDAGISRFGRQVIAEMNRVGMLIDMSHSAELTSLQAIEISERPITITHANPLSFHKGIRNKSDDLLKALAESGGMLGFSTYPFHIGGTDTTLDAFCGMIVDTVEKLGIDRVGIGTDMCRKLTSGYLDWMRSGRWSKEIDSGEAKSAGGGWPDWPDWFQTTADFPNITQGLLDKGFSQADTARIMGGNWLEFFRDGFAPR
ncbi:MAG: membrane dipeptidase [Rhodospirillaceae bacterium]|nr:membrane dipeptidase [Rhodospirillaceae bacterium]